MNVKKNSINDQVTEEPQTHIAQLKKLVGKDFNSMIPTVCLPEKYKTMESVIMIGDCCAYRERMRG